MRGIRAKPGRSVLTAAGIAVAVAFFVLFAAMSMGLHSFIEGELDRPRPVHIFLSPTSPTPYTTEDLAYLELVVAQEAGPDAGPWWVAPSIELPVSASPSHPSIRLWGTWLGPGGGPPSPPYDTGASLSWGRHLDVDDRSLGTGPIPCVLGSSARSALFPEAGEGDIISVGPDGTVDPWWFPEASAYPVEGRPSVVAHPRGPVEATVVGLLAPGQGDDLDWGVYMPVHPLLGAIGQYDGVAKGHYYPQAVVTFSDGTRVDVLAVKAAISRQMPGTESTDDAWDREGFEGSYGAASDALNGWLAVVTGVMVVLLVAGISDTMLMTVADRRTEIATLRALGHRRGRIFRLVLMEVALLATVGLLVGLSAGGSLAYLFGHLHEISGGEGIFFAPVTVGPLVVAAGAVIALGTAVIAALYPAHKAARESPTEALRYE